MTTTLQIEEGKFYRTRSGEKVGPVRHDPNYYHREFPFVCSAPSTSDRSRFAWRPDGTWGLEDSKKPLDLVEEVPNPAIEDDGFVTVDPSVETALAGQVSPAEAMQDLAAAEAVESRTDAVIAAAVTATEAKYDIKTVIADEAKRIVSGARRSAYGRPEQNFERIARYWDAYFKNRGIVLREADATPYTISAADVSPLMVLMKMARLAESPQHYDSMVDAVGYVLTMSEVNGVSKPA